MRHADLFFILHSPLHKYYNDKAVLLFHFAMQSLSKIKYTDIEIARPDNIYGLILLFFIFSAVIG